MDKDFDGFKAYLDESKENDDFIFFDEAECYDTEAEAHALSGGIGYGGNDHATLERFPVRSCEKDVLPFIEVIENNKYFTLFNFSMQDYGTIAH